jgi:O-acetyl-ADP-ribose deacetylase (regulator of RNase III)
LESWPNVILVELRNPHGARIRIVQGDITEEPVDAIVNAANGRLSHGGGVAGAIVRRGGAAIQEESDAWVEHHGEVPTGSAAITGAGDLEARYVIHAVGPVWGSGDEEAKLARAARSALDLAMEYGLESISLPAISSGIFGFPKDRCAKVLLEVVLASEGPEEIRLCNLDDLTAGIFRDEALRARRNYEQRADECGGSST